MLLLAGHFLAGYVQSTDTQRVHILTITEEILCWPFVVVQLSSTQGVTHTQPATHIDTRTHNTPTHTHTHTHTHITHIDTHRNRKCVTAKQPFDDDGSVSRYVSTEYTYIITR